MATLLPVPGKSVNFESTKHAIIEGDNLEVLKLLQKSYLGKVKMIYIDPPYNTGNDFIYPDDYGETLRTYLETLGKSMPKVVGSAITPILMAASTRSGST